MNNIFYNARGPPTPTASINRGDYINHRGEISPRNIEEKKI